MKKRSSYALVKRFVIFVFLPIVAVFGYGVSYLQDSLPSESDVLYVNGLTKAVTVSRNQYGALSIEAANDDDAFFAVGFSHAQDRLWQLELLRRTSRGELSEVLGKRGVSSDIHLKTLKLYEKSRESVQYLSEPAKRSLVAYANGVNAFLRSDNVLPVELKMTGIQPEPWEPADSIAILKLLALQLSENNNSELHKAAHHQFFHPDSQTDSALCKVAKSTEDCLGQIINAITNPISGSAFVVSKRAISNEYSLLVSDFQSDAGFPVGWYVVRLKTDHLNNTGMTLVGLPVPLFGHNSHFAWAGINRLDNSQQLVAELTDINNYNVYKNGETWQLFDESEESILIKPDLPFGYSKEYEPIRVQRRESVNGPVINDNNSLFDFPLTLKWTGLRSDDTSYEAFYKLNYANNWETFHQALRLLIAPGLNMVFVDRQGNIGKLSAGAVPITDNEPTPGPWPGWDRGAVWQGYVSPSEWPAQYNPESGFVAVTSQPISNDLPNSASFSAENIRYERIKWLLEHQLLADDRDVTLEGALSVQQDTFSSSGKALVDLFLSLEMPKDASYLRSDLSQWSGEMDADSNVASIVSVWSILLKRNLFIDELALKQEQLTEEPALIRLIDRIPLNIVVQLLTASPESQICDNKKTSSAESCDAIVVSSFLQALDRIRLILGGDPGDWDLKSLSYKPFRHASFTDINVLNTLFDRRMFVEGGEDSVKQAAVATLTSRGVEHNVVSNFIQGMLVSDRRFSYKYSLVPGQSGNALSEHFDDMLPSAQNGTLEPLTAISDEFNSGYTLQPVVAETIE